MAIGANSISEEFDGLIDGDISGQGSYTHASSWSTAGTGVSCAVIVVDPGGGDKFMRLDDNVIGQKAVASLSLDSGYRSESGYVQFGIQHNSTNFTSYFLLQSSSSESNSICGVGLDDGTTQIRAWDGASWSNLQAYTSGVTYTVKITFDVDAGSALFYVNGSLKATKSLVGSTSPVTHLFWRTVDADADNGRVIVDHLVFEGDAVTDAIHYVDTVTDSLSLSPSVSQIVDYTATPTVTISLSPTALHQADFNVTVTDTVNLTPSIGSSQSLRPTYEYYFGTDSGTVHIYSDTYKGDAGMIIACQYITKNTDFADQDNASNDRWKTVYAIKLFYEDVYADTDIVAAISTDGGVTWPYSKSQTLGNGNGARKDSVYHFIVTGQFFMFRASSGSASSFFKLLGMEIEYQDSGEHWATA